MRFAGPLTLTSLAFVVGQFWIAGKSWLRGRELPPRAKRVASTGDLAVGGSMVFDYPAPHDACILVRLSEAEYVAFSQKCTHLSCAVIPRPDEGVFHCPCHEGYFDLATGQPTAGPPRRSLPKIKLKIQDGNVYATQVEEHVS